MKCNKMIPYLHKFGDFLLMYSEFFRSPYIVLSVAMSNREDLQNRWERNDEARQTKDALIISFSIITADYLQMQ